MSTIKEKIDEIYDIKQEIKQSLINKGYSEEEITNNFAKYPELIRGLDVIKFPQWFKDSLVCWYDPKKQGLTNEQIMTENKAKGYFTLKDFSPIPKAVDSNTQFPTNQPCDMKCYNFNGEGMSGMDGYGTNFKTWNLFTDTLSYKINHNSFTISTINKKRIGNFNVLKKYKTTTNSLVVNIAGIVNNYSFDYEYYQLDGTITTMPLKNGINILPNIPNSDKTYGFAIHRWDMQDDINITLILLPEYKDALVFDGVDDYGISENQPMLEDYTVIVKREVLKLDGFATIATKRLDPKTWGEFAFERNNTTASFGELTYVKINQDKVSWQTPYSYNGIKLIKGTGGATNQLAFATAYTFRPLEALISFALYQFLLFNRTLTPEEIDWVKKNIMGWKEIPEQLEGKGVTNV